MFSFTKTDEQDLLNIAHQSIEHGLKNGECLKVNQVEYPTALQQPHGAFTTLKCNGALRGCKGSLEVTLPLVNTVAYSAYSSAFNDIRFPPLQPDEFTQLKISLSVLSPKEKLSFTNEEDLIEQIQPGIDGLVLEYNGQRGTLLPSVWKTIPDAREFLCIVKQKAGFDRDFWDEDLQAYRYTTHTIQD
jgi:AmmeMemoRadiSam system protein A